MNIYDRKHKNVLNSKESKFYENLEPEENNIIHENEEEYKNCKDETITEKLIDNHNVNNTNLLNILNYYK
jgi:hypothetical protein